MAGPGTHPGVRQALTWPEAVEHVRRTTLQVADLSVPFSPACRSRAVRSFSNALRSTGSYIIGAELGVISLAQALQRSAACGWCRASTPRPRR